MKYDFSGWATRNDLLCADGRTIKKDAFKDCDGQSVPLVFGHNHKSVDAILGNALLENRDEGVYAYGTFNDTESGETAKKLVQHGDVVSLSICANDLTEVGKNVVHGTIRELSLVLAGANPGAYIDAVMAHSDDGQSETIESLTACWDENIMIYHADEKLDNADKKKDKEDEENKEETVGDVFDTLNEKQKTLVYALIGQALEEADDENNSEEGDDDMKHNVFDNDSRENTNVLTHSDQEGIVSLAKTSNVGSFQAAIDMYAKENKDTLTHGYDDITNLFPEPHDLMPGAPEAIPDNNDWVSTVMKKVHKSPFNRIRTRQADISEIRAGGYVKGTEKVDMGNISLVSRTTDPQTIYIKDKLDRDDIIDITDFDAVAYEYNVMRQALHEEIATAILIGDGRNDGDDQRINPVHVRPIWLDDELYTIHADVDIAAAQEELQGSGTSTNFGDNYIRAEAIITAALYAREGYKGSGALDFYCTPHLLNVMLLARDLNGRRIYNSKSDLAAALNVKEIYEVDKFENKTRVTTDTTPKTKKLLGIFVNLNDYNVGSVRNGAITQFNQFDIDFNREKFLIETRMSGAITRVKSAIVLEETVTDPTNNE